MIGLIGGTGVYDPKLLREVKEVEIKTPFGKPSDKIITGLFEGVKIAFLNRHGKGHSINPTNVNYRANIWALKELGCERIIATGAVGSLKEEFKPGEIVFTDQFIDRTTKRETTFYDKDKVVHISSAEPICKELREILINEAKKENLLFHEKGTCIVIEGPRFSSKAESNLFRQWGADIIGMTMFPECILAREQQICYATIATVTDYDVWKDSYVNIEEVIQIMKENIEKVKILLEKVIPIIPKQRTCECATALKNAEV